MTRKEIIDGLEIYTAGRLNKDRVHITVKELQKFIDEIKDMEQEPCEDWYDVPSDEMTLGQARQAVKDLRKKVAEYLWQEPCKDVMSIHTQGLDEGIKCAMCTNSMKSDRGCDGGCIVDDEMYKRVMNTINNHVFKQEPLRG